MSKLTYIAKIKRKKRAKAKWREAENGLAIVLLHKLLSIAGGNRRGFNSKGGTGNRHVRRDERSPEATSYGPWTPSPTTATSPCTSSDGNYSFPHQQAFTSHFNNHFSTSTPSHLHYSWSRPLPCSQNYATKWQFPGN